MIGVITNQHWLYLWAHLSDVDVHSTVNKLSIIIIHLRSITLDWDVKPLIWPSDHQGIKWMKHPNRKTLAFFLTLLQVGERAGAAVQGGAVQPRVTTAVQRRDPAADHHPGEHRHWGHPEPGAHLQDDQHQRYRPHWSPFVVSHTGSNLIHGRALDITVEDAVGGNSGICKKCRRQPCVINEWNAQWAYLFWWTAPSAFRDGKHFSLLQAGFWPIRAFLPWDHWAAILPITLPTTLPFICIVIVPSQVG